MGEACVARLHSFDADVATPVHHVARKDFLGNGPWPRLGRNRWQKDFALQAGNIERKQAAVFDDLARDFVFALGELQQRNLFSPANLVNQVEVGRGQHAEVLAILLVDALDVFCDHQLDAGRHLGVGRLFAA